MEIKPIGGAIWRTGAGQDDIREMEEVKGALEALLFVADEPLTPRRLAEALECDEGKVLSALQELRDEYVRYNRGMQLREVGGGWRMHTHPAYAAQIERLLLSSRRARLTRAAVETLAIIAYMQPITRGQVANLRGVQSENMVKALEEMGLVAEAGKEKAPGGPALYVTTEKFLERFGLNSLDDLPPLEDFQPDAETVDRIARSLSGQTEPDADAVPGPGEAMADGLGARGYSGDTDELMPRAEAGQSSQPRPTGMVPDYADEVMPRVGTDQGEQTQQPGTAIEDHDGVMPRAEAGQAPQPRPNGMVPDERDEGTSTIGTDTEEGGDIETGTSPEPCPNHVPHPQDYVDEAAPDIEADTEGGGDDEGRDVS